MVVSTDTKAKLHERYATVAPNVTLAAENGFFWRWNSVNKKIDEWNKLLLDTTEFSWIEHVRQIMEMYVNRTYGSFIEQKEAFIIWNFSKADHLHGKTHAEELKNSIK